MCHPLEHDCYRATSLDLVRIVTHRGRKTIMSCSFEKVSRHIQEGETRAVLPVSHVALPQSLIVCASKSGDGHLLDSFLRIERHVDNYRHISSTDLHRSRRELFQAK
jgi:hypothetical protein